MYAAGEPRIKEKGLYHQATNSYNMFHVLKSEVFFLTYPKATGSFGPALARFHNFVLMCIVYCGSLDRFSCASTGQIEVASVSGVKLNGEAS